MKAVKNKPIVIMPPYFLVGEKQHGVDADMYQLLYIREDLARGRLYLKNLENELNQEFKCEGSRLHRVERCHTLHGRVYYFLFLHTYSSGDKLRLSKRTEEGGRHEVCGE